MRKIFIAAAIFIATASIGVGQTNNDKEEKTEQQIIKIMDDWAVASGQRDITATGRFLPEDFTITDCDGSVQTKAQYLEMVKNVPGDFVIRDTEQKVRVFGDTAVMTAHYTVEGKANKRVFITARYMCVFQKQSGKWMPIAFQRVCQTKTNDKVKN
ncbi:MAG: nuclear transport factor 2 family protein [Acidobacteriota bacterium]|nr:nuclear transport factor 2 family protein [Acidobacteriota bacterium]